MKRVPEPELMDSLAQTAGYAGADFSEPNELFVGLLLEHSIQDDARVIDLGCGPGDIVCRLAERRPNWRFVAVDGGPNMLAHARAAFTASGIGDRVQVLERLLPDISGLTPATVVISNSLLHHLPDPMTLWSSVAALSEPGAIVQVMDLARPASTAAVDRLVHDHAADEPEVLQEDFRNSLHAAYTADEVREQIAEQGLTLDVTMVSDRHWVAATRRE